MLVKGAPGIFDLGQFLLIQQPKWTVTLIKNTIALSVYRLYKPELVGSFEFPLVFPAPASKLTACDSHRLELSQNRISGRWGICGNYSIDDMICTRIWKIPKLQINNLKFSLENLTIPLDYMQQSAATNRPLKPTERQCNKVTFNCS